MGIFKLGKVREKSDDWGFNLEMLKMSIVSLKEEMKVKKVIYDDMSGEVSEDERVVGELNSCISLLEKDIRDIEDKIKYMSSHRDLIKKDYESALERRDNNLKILREKEKLLEELIKGVDTGEIDKERRKLYELNKNNAKIERDIKRVNKEIKEIKLKEVKEVKEVKELNNDYIEINSRDRSRDKDTDIDKRIINILNKTLKLTTN
jgi:chromosome segregation ATPase